MLRQHQRTRSEDKTQNAGTYDLDAKVAQANPIRDARLDEPGLPRLAIDAEQLTGLERRGQRDALDVHPRRVSGQRHIALLFFRKSGLQDLMSQWVWVSDYGRAMRAVVVGSRG